MPCQPQAVSAERGLFPKTITNMCFVGIFNMRANSLYDTPPMATSSSARNSAR